MAITHYNTFPQYDGKEIIKVYLKDTSKFKDRYFYTSVPSPKVCKAMGFTYQEVEARVYDLLKPKKYNWFLRQSGNDEAIMGYHKSDTSNALYFHRELYKAYWNKDIEEGQVINHINKVCFDNTDDNLNVVNKSQAILISFSRGYSISPSGAFCNRISADYLNTRADFGENYDKKTGTLCGKSSEKEFDACSQQYDFELKQAQALLGSNAYVYNILDDFRGHEDILDQVRTGVEIETEEKIETGEKPKTRKMTDSDAKLLLLEQTDSTGLKIKENAWYYYRYNLAGFFKEHGIPVPKYTTDKDGYMVHPETGKHLCPLN